MSRPFLATALLLALGASPASAETQADGRALVKANCAACHAIDGLPAPAGAKGPGFVDIARMPSTTQLSLKVFMQSSHGNMPNLVLNADEIDAIAAYILDLALKQ